MSVWEGLRSAGLFLYLLIGAAGWGQLGLNLLRRWSRDGEDDKSPLTRLEKSYLSPVLGMGLISCFFLLLGLAKLLYVVTAWGLLALGWAIWALTLIRARRGKAKFVQRTGNQKRSAPMRQRVLDTCLALLGLGSLLCVLPANTLVPPHEWDEIAYHMALAKIYVQSHGLVYLPYVLPSNWPLSTEMLFAAGLLLGSELVAHFITWWMTLWTAWGLYLIGRRFLSRRIGWLAAMLYLTVPLVKRLTGSGLIDVSLAFYGTAAILAYARYRQNRSLGWAGLSGLFSGLAASSKLMGGAYPLILGLLIVLDSQVSPRLHWRTLLTRLGIFWGFGLLMVGPWYLRSYAYTGNPIWPFLYSVFAGKNWDALGREYYMQELFTFWTADLPLSLRGFAKSLYYVFFEPASLGGYHGGLGQVLLVLAGMSVVFMVIRRKTSQFILALLLFCGLYYVLWFLLLSHHVRYFFPILPALALLAAFAFYTIWDHLPNPLLQWALAGVLVLSLARDFPLVEAGQRGYLKEQLRYATGHLSRDAFLDTRIDVMPAIRYINSELRPDAVVLLLPYENRGYYLERSYFVGHPIWQRVIRFEQYDDPTILAEDVRTLGITHILDSPGWQYTGLRHWEHDRALMLALETQCGEQIAAWDDIVLYRLVECHE